MFKPLKIQRLFYFNKMLRKILNDNFFKLSYSYNFNIFIFLQLMIRKLCYFINKLMQ